MQKLLLILLATFSLVSCKKASENYSKTMTVSGVVYDSTNHIGMQGRIVKASTRDEPNTYLGVTTTDAQGNFKMAFPVDVRIFDTQTVSITTDVPEGYISIIDKWQPSVGFGIWMYVPEVTSQKLILFKKTSLSVTFQRTQTDVFTEIVTAYRYSDWYTHGISVIPYSASPANPLTYQIETAAATHTVITRTKKLPSGDLVQYRDSIFCMPNAANAITINY